MILDLIHINKKYNLKINGVIHVGAHHGQEHNIYKQLNINNIVYFEPVKKTFDTLKDKVSDALLYNVALGNDNKDIEMFVEDADAYGCSSILQPSSNYNGISFSNKEIVEMRTLDSFNFTNFNFLNIDVQGYEMEVLKGAEKTLNCIDYIMCEINKNTTQKPMDYIGAQSVEIVINFLKKYNFELVEENWAGISWGDGFFIKK
jgi:FkbM family methyltransferase